MESVIIKEEDGNLLTPFMCGVCSEKFKHMNMLYQHLKVHDIFLCQSFHVCCDTDEFRYRCYSCSCNFVSICILHDHILNSTNNGSYMYDSSKNTAYPLVRHCSFLEARNDGTLFDNEEQCKQNTGHDFVQQPGFPDLNCYSEKIFKLWSELSCWRNDGVSMEQCSEVPSAVVNNDQETNIELTPGFDIGNSSKYGNIYNNTIVSSQNSNRELKCCKKQKRDNSLKIRKQRGKHKHGDIACKSGRNINTCEFSDCVNAGYTTVNDLVKTTCKNESHLQTDFVENNTFSVNMSTSELIDKKGDGSGASLTTEIIRNLEVLNKSKSKKNKVTFKGEKSLDIEDFNDNMTINTNNVTMGHVATAAERPFNCDKCEKTFKRKHHLASHKITHDDVKPFYCEVCGQGFTMAHNLKVHSLIHTGEKQFKCSLCSAAFLTQSKLNRHSNSHTGVKKMQCDLCGMRFTQRDNLNQHITGIHMGERRFSCSECDRKFMTNYQLKCHMMKHSGIRPYKCSYCKADFIERKELRRHLKKLHKLSLGDDTTCSSDTKIKSNTGQRSDPEVQVQMEPLNGLSLLTRNDSIGQERETVSNMQGRETISNNEFLSNKVTV